MRGHRRALFAAVLALALFAAGCSRGATSGTAGTSGGSASEPAAAPIPAAFKGEAAQAVELKVAADGGGAVVRSGDATAAVYVPAGAAAAGTWRVVPLTAAPAGPKKALCPGVYVDTAGAKPTQPCIVGFSLPGTAPAGATIVRIADDGAVSVVPTTRVERGSFTLLSAAVDGFSAYTTSEEDKAAADKAFVDKAKAKGKQVDWTIKAGGKETQTNEGWTFDYELDLFASGGDVAVGGVYNGHASLSLEGKYKGPASIVKTFGKVSGIGRDPKLAFVIIDAPLVSLLTGEPIEDPIVAGQGVMNLEGMGSLDISAVAPNASGRVDKQNQPGKGGVPFTITVKGEDVQVEIAGVGIFPGKILRTTK